MMSCVCYVYDVACVVFVMQTMLRVFMCMKLRVFVFEVACVVCLCV